MSFDIYNLQELSVNLSAEDKEEKAKIEDKLTILEDKSEEELAGYQIVNAYAQSISLFPDKPVEGVPKLETTIKNARNTATDIKDNYFTAMNNLANQIETGFASTFTHLKSDILKEAAKLEKNDDGKTIFKTMVEVVLGEIAKVNNEIKKLADKTNTIRNNLESDIRAFGGLSQDITLKLGKDDIKIKKIEQTIKEITNKISWLTKDVVRIEFEEKSKQQSFAINALTVIFPLPMAIYRGHLHISTNDKLKNLRHEIQQKENEKTKSQIDLKNINERVTYLNTLQTELSKAYNYGTASTTVIMNMRDAWLDVFGHLKAVMDKLDTPFLRNGLLTIYFKLLDGTVENLKKCIETYKDRKLIVIPIDQKLSPRALAYGIQDDYLKVDSRVFWKYIQEDRLRQK